MGRNLIEEKKLFPGRGSNINWEKCMFYMSNCKQNNTFFFSAGKECIANLDESLLLISSWTSLSSNCSSLLHLGSSVRTFFLTLRHNPMMDAKSYEK